MSHSLRREYAYYSWKYKFADEIEEALEDDYVNNKSMYTDATLKCVQMLLVIAPDAGPEEVINQVRFVHE